MPRTDTCFLVNYAVIPGFVEASLVNTGCQLHISHTVVVPGSTDVHTTTVTGLCVIDSPMDIALAMVVLMKKSRRATVEHHDVVEKIAQLLHSIQ